MSALETAIKTALDQSDRHDPQVRARIYQSARQALEAGLRKQDITDPAALALHRRRLETTIHAIESEERAQIQEPPAARARVEPGFSGFAPQTPSETPASLTVEGERRESAPAAAKAAAANAAPAGRREPAFTDFHAAKQSEASPLAAPGLDGLDGRDARPDSRDDRNDASSLPLDFPAGPPVRRKPRKFFSRLLIVCVLLAFAGIGVWWVQASGLLLTPQERDTSVANPPASTTPEDFDGTQPSSQPNAAANRLDNGFSADWLEVFKPAGGAGEITNGAQAQSSPVSQSEGPAVQLVSQTNADAGNFSIVFPRSVIEQMRGKISTVALSLKAADDAPTQVIVECNFASAPQACARHRLPVAPQRSDILIEVDLRDAATFAGDGTLILNTDAEGKGRGVNLFAVRVLPAP